MAVVKRKKISGLLAMIERLKAENADLRAKLEKEQENWSEVECGSVTTEERRALLQR